MVRHKWNDKYYSFLLIMSPGTHLCVFSLLFIFPKFCVYISLLYITPPIHTPSQAQATSCESLRSPPVDRPYKSNKMEPHLQCDS